MAKVFTITVPPKLGNKRRERTSDPRYVDGQKLLVDAMKYRHKTIPSGTVRRLSSSQNT